MVSRFVVVVAQDELRRIARSLSYGNTLAKIVHARPIFREFAESEEEPLARNSRRRERVRPVAVGSQPRLAFGHSQSEAARPLGLVEVGTERAP